MMPAKSWVAALASALAAVATCAVAQEAAPIPSPREPVLRGNASLYYPDRAYRAGTRGVAVIDCVASAAGRLTDCVVVGESPFGENFGDAALLMALRKAVVAAPPADGAAPVDGAKVRLRVPFDPHR